jgi:hypothetical protein
MPISTWQRIVQPGCHHQAAGTKPTAIPVHWNIELNPRDQFGNSTNESDVPE